MRRSSRYLAILLAFLLFAAWVASGRFWFATSFTGKVVDEQSRPVAGADVLVTWRARSIFEAAPGPVIQLAETKTDSAGVFHSPGGSGFFSFTRFMRCDEPYIQVLHDDYIPELTKAGRCRELSEARSSIDMTPKDPQVRLTRADSPAKDPDQRLRAMEWALDVIYWDQRMVNDAPTFHAAAERWSGRVRKLRAAQIAGPPGEFQWNGPGQVATGNTFTVDLEMQSVWPVRSAAVVIGFDPRVFQVVEVAPGDFLKKGDGSADFDQMVDLETGQVRASIMGDAASAPTGRALVRLTLRALEPADQTSLRLLSLADNGPPGHILQWQMPPPHELTVKR